MRAIPRPFNLRRLVGLADPGPGDGELLRQYVSTGDPDAFAALVRRHARSVLGACRRVVTDPHAAEDAFQATFLQLARKARGLRTPAALVGWLYRTARRTALRHRRPAALPSPAGRPSPACNPLDVLTARELLAAIEHEIDRLPESYRLPLVLCYLDGMSKDAAADQLGVPTGVFRGRLDRGREKLRAALTRRGFAPAAVLGLLVPAAGAGVSGELLSRTVAVCARGEPAAAAVLALAAAGRSGVAIAAALAAGLLILAGGIGLLASAGPADPQSPPPTVVRNADPQPRMDLHRDPLPPHAIARMGSVRWRHHEEMGNQLHVVPSPTGKLVATAAVGFGVIRVYDLSDGGQVCEFPWERSAGYEVRFTTDGTRVFYLTERGVVRFFDPATGKRIGETKPVVENDVPGRVRGNPDKWNEEWTTHQLTKDGRWVVTAHPVDRQFTLTLTEIPAGTAEPRRVRLDLPPSYRKGVEVFHYVRVGETLIGAGRERRGPVVFRWDLQSGKITKTTPIEVRENGFDLSADGKRLATYRGGMKVWDTETGAEAVQLEEPTRAGYGTRFSPDGKRLVGIIDDPENETTATATVWEMDSGKAVSRVKLPRRYDNPFLLADGKTLLAASRGLMFSTWDLATGRRLSPAAGHENLVYHLAFSADGKTLFSTALDRGDRVTAWEATTGTKLHELAAPSGHSKFVLTPGGAVVTAVSDDSLVWADSVTGREIRRVGPAPQARDPNAPQYGIELSACRDPRTGRPAVCGLLTMPRTGEKVVALWDAGSGEPLARRPIPSGRFDHFRAVSPDGQLVARDTADLSADDDKGVGVGLNVMLGRQAIVLDDTLTGSTLLRLGQADYLQSGSPGFTPDGQALVTWTSTYPDDGKRPGVTTVRLWELRSGKQRLAIPLPVIGKWWEYEPRAVALSADGRLLVGARPDKTISVWDLTTGSEVAKRAGYGAAVACLAFRPDGKALASGHADGTALVWDLSGVTPTRPAPMDRAAAWNDLASDDAGKAYRVILALAADAGCAAFLKDRVKPVAAVPAELVRQLIGDLDSAAFATRERATAGLTALGDAADDHLRAALKGNLSAEQRQRVEGILGKRSLVEPDPDRLRALRCVEVLERSATPDARAVLGELAKGAAGARLTREAGDALRRLSPGS